MIGSSMFLFERCGMPLYAHILSDFVLIRDIFLLIPYICVTLGTTLSEIHICPNFLVGPNYFFLFYFVEWV